MKKWLIRILKLTGILVALYLIIAVFSPSEYHVERDRNYSVKKEILFEQVGYFENWLTWSPWVQKDPNAKYITTADGAVGAEQSWVGDPDSVGTGNMVVTEWVEHEKIRYDLTFESMGMTSHGGLTLTENEDQTININWYDEGTIPFMFRPMMLFFDIDAKIGPDFERGLANIDLIATEKQAEYDALNSFVISEVDFESVNYYGVMMEMNIADIDSNTYGNAYGKIMSFMMSKDIQMLEGRMPGCLTFEWDDQAGLCKLMPIIPVEDNSREGEDMIEAFTVNSTKAIVVDFYGDYSNLGAGHQAAEKYLKENEFTSSMSIEEFITDPTSVETTDEVLTKIYYILD